MAQNNTGYFLEVNGMGFLSGLTGGQKTTTPATGYYSLPADLKGQYTTAYNAIPGATTPAQFTPPPFNPDQLAAFGMARNIANPTAGGISSMISPFMNPYDEAVQNNINRDAMSQNSLVTQQGQQVGQMGSNRNFLASSDVEQNRLNNSNIFRQAQYNKALDTALGQQQTGFAALSGIGDQQQQQEWGVQQAPFNALSAQFGLLNPVAQFVGSSVPSQTYKTGGGLGGLINLAKTGMQLYSGAGGGSMFGAGWNASPGVGWSGNTFLG